MRKFIKSNCWSCAVLLCLLAARTVAAAEPVWPQFRGPEANPVSSNAKLEDKWGKTENVEWMTDIPGRGWSSPIVWGDRVFLTSDNYAGTFEGIAEAP